MWNNNSLSLQNILVLQTHAAQLDSELYGEEQNVKIEGGRGGGYDNFNWQFPT